jgi:hypothetical protein
MAPIEQKGMGRPSRSDRVGRRSSCARVVVVDVVMMEVVACVEVEVVEVVLMGVLSWIVVAASLRAL